MSVHRVCDVVLMFKFLSVMVPRNEHRSWRGRFRHGPCAAGRALAVGQIERPAPPLIQPWQAMDALPSMATATWNGTVVAESDATIIVEGNDYFPSTSVRTEHLRPSTHSTVPLERDSERLRRGRG